MTIRTRMIGSRTSCLTVAALCLQFVAAVPAHALGPTATVTPAHPTTRDEISLDVEGWLPDSCWRYLGHVFSAPSDSQFTVDVQLAVTAGYCLQRVGSYDFACPIGPLPAGSYAVHVVEDSPYLPGDVEGRHDDGPRFVPTSFTLRFDVVEVSEDPSPTTWSGLKALFR